MLRRIIAAPRRIAAVLDEVRLVSEPGEPHHILQVVPGEASKGPLDNVAQHNNA